MILLYFVEGIVCFSYLCIVPQVLEKKLFSGPMLQIDPEKSLV